MWVDGLNQPPTPAELLFAELQLLLLSYKATVVLCPSSPGSHLPVCCIPESKASCSEGNASTSLTGTQFPQWERPSSGLYVCAGSCTHGPSSEKNLCWYLKTLCNVLPEETGNAYVNTHIFKEQVEGCKHSSMSTKQFNTRLQRCCR